MLSENINIFTTIFLAIFMEAAPFLLLGTLMSGFIEVFISREEMTRLIPRNRILATVAGGAMGFLFPVCECGVVPLTRRLFRKGFPVSAGIAFLLAAPIVNPITLASTYVAYGWSDILIGRFVLGLLIPVGIALLFFRNVKTKGTQAPEPAAVRLEPVMQMAGVGAVPVSAFAPLVSTNGHTHRVEEVTTTVAAPPREPLLTRFRRALRIAGDEAFEMGKFLIIGCALAALMQTFVPQETLVNFGSGPIVSVLVMQLVAFVLSVCSTVDAFISLAFVNTFTTGSILAFLVYGPMVDVKSTIMFLGVFPRRTVAALIVLPFITVALVASLINLL